LLHPRRQDFTVEQTERLINQLCRQALVLEDRLAEGLDVDGRPVGVDTPGIGLLVGLDTFGSLRPGAVAGMLGLSSGGTTKLVQRLEAVGLVTRSFGSLPEDRRAVVIEITEHGRRVVGRFEAVVSELAPGWAQALAPLASSPDQRLPRGEVHLGVDPSASTAGPVTSAMFDLVTSLEQPVIEAIGDLDVLHPADPRPLLLLTELDLEGPVKVGEVGPLLGRSRASINTLLGELAEGGLVDRRPDGRGADRRVVLVRLSRRGRRVAQEITATVKARIPEIRPVIDTFLETASQPAR
jgi:DNA-binding MarR family transcriptional regulator